MGLAPINLCSVMIGIPPRRCHINMKFSFTRSKNSGPIRINLHTSRIRDSTYRLTRTFSLHNCLISLQRRSFHSVCIHGKITQCTTKTEASQAFIRRFLRWPYLLAELLSGRYSLCTGYLTVQTVHFAHSPFLSVLVILFLIRKSLSNISGKPKSSAKKCVLVDVARNGLFREGGGQEAGEHIEGISALLKFRELFSVFLKFFFSLHNFGTPYHGP